MFEAGIALYALVLPWLLDALDLVYGGVVGWLPDGVLARSLVRFVLCVAVLAVPPLMELGVVLIFDEIVNFWLDHGGTGALFDVEPDLCCYGKGIGGGLPMGLIGGREDIMNLFNQKEEVRVAAIAAHTGDPMTVASSKACLEILDAAEIARLNSKGNFLADGMRNILKDLGIRGQVLGYGNHQSLHLTTAEQVLDPVMYLINNHTPGLSETMALFRRSLINKGVMTLENMMALRTSTPLTEDEIAMALDAMRECFGEIHPILKELTPQLLY